MTCSPQNPDEGMCGLQRRGYVRITEMGYNLCVSNRDGGMYELQRRGCVWIEATGVCT